MITSEEEEVEEGMRRARFKSVRSKSMQETQWNAYPNLSYTPSSDYYMKVQNIKILSTTKTKRNVTNILMLAFYVLPIQPFSYVLILRTTHVNRRSENSLLPAFP